MAPTFRFYLSPQLAQQFASAEFNRHLHDRSLVPTQELDDADLVLLSGDEALPETAAPVNWLEPGKIDGRIVLRHNLAPLGELEPVSVAAALTDLPPVPQIGSRDEARKAFVQEALHHSVPAQAEPLADLIAQWAHTAAPALPKISVIINNYNYGAYLADAIDSALGQSVPCHEVIVVDDGSTDESRDIIAHYDQVTPVLKANGGQASAFNAGFAASSGDVVLFLDADDRLRPDAVETVQAELHGLTSRMSFGLQIIGSDGRPMGLFHMSRAARQDQVAGRLLEDGFFFIMPTSGNAFPRWVLDTLLPMPEPEWKISADLYLSLAVALLGPTRHLDKVLADYRVHGQNSFHQRLGPQPYQNPRKFAQRRAALETMCHEIARGRFGSSSDRDRLRAQLLKSSEFWVERWAGRALDWWSQRPASPERPIIPTKMRMDETQIRPPAHIRRLLCQRDPFLFGGRSTWPAQRLSEWTDLANAATGVLGRGWDLRGGEGARLAETCGTLGLRFDGPRNDIDLQLRFAVDKQQGPVEFWLNGVRIDVRTIAPDETTVLCLPGELMEFDTLLQAYVSRLLIWNRAPGTEITLTALTTDIHLPSRKTAPWLPTATEIAGTQLDRYLVSGWDWPTATGADLCDESGLMVFTVAGRADHALYLRFDGPAPAIVLQEGMTLPMTGHGDGEVSVTIPSDQVPLSGIVTLKCLPLDGAATKLAAMRLDPLGKPDALLPGRAATGASTATLPKLANGGRIWLGLEADSDLPFPAYMTLSMDDTDEPVQFVLGGPEPVPIEVPAGPGCTRTLRSQRPDGLSVTEMSLSPLAEPTEILGEWPGLASVRSDPTAWHDEAEGVHWLAVSETRLLLQLSRPTTGYLHVDVLTLPDPPQQMVATLAGQSAHSEGAGPSTLILLLPGEAELELTIRTNILVAKTALGIEETGWLGGGMVRLAVSGEE